MGIEDDNPRVKELKAQIAERLDQLEKDIETERKIEALDFDETLYGIDRFRESIIRYRGEAAQTMASQLLWDVRRFAGLAPQSDDISIVVAKVG